MTEYLDTNILVYAIERHPEYGKSCKEILIDIYAGKRKVCCSVLVLVELISVLRKINTQLRKTGKDQLDVRANVDAVLSLPINWVDLNLFVIKRSAEYEYAISGPDCIHIATMEVENITRIISADRDFEKVDFVKRVDPLDD